MQTRNSRSFGNTDTVNLRLSVLPIDNNKIMATIRLIDTFINAIASGVIIPGRIQGSRRTEQLFLKANVITVGGDSQQAHFATPSAWTDFARRYGSRTCGHVSRSHSGVPCTIPPDITDIGGACIIGPWSENAISSGLRNIKRKQVNIQ